MYKDPRGTWGRIRRAFRRVGNTKSVLEPWMQLLPSQSEYFSILCGGLKLIYTAAARLEDLREEIYRALEELPSLLSITYRAVDIFTKSERLQEASIELYVATLGLLEHIVNWFTERAAKKVLKSFLKQEAYQRELGDKVQSVRIAAKRFDQEAHLCSYRHLIDARFDIKAHTKLTRENHDDLLAEFSRLGEITGQQNASLASLIADKNSANNQMIQMMAQRVLGIEAAIAQLTQTRLSQQTLNILNFTPRMTVGAVLPANALPPNEGAFGSSSFHRLQPSDSVYRSIDLTHVERDLSLNSKPIEAVPRATQDRTVFAVLSPQFQSWMASPLSEFIFMNFNTPSAPSPNPSAYLCACLVSAVRQAPAAVVSLSFFCREHKSVGDAYYGATGMMRSLIAQLMAQRPNLRNPYSNSEEESSVTDLCITFETLLLQLRPQDLAFCVVDCINCYEDNERLCPEFEETLETLLNLQSRTRVGGCAFKLLLACPWNSHRMVRLVPEQERAVVWLPAKVPSQGGLTGTKWKALMEKNFSFLR
ncbi:hypothetical protein NKR23_g4164 [Pleurostoma richardsiae]|uniref:Uncharacterized protein n=1 Tax=Pleurostoma richardsiae TaxID=41990 RepID=A0AA38VSH2_9PEZI|nr:hypothetical protein NKR23_g4164 [Pleurostoma richardsiae]